MQIETYEIEEINSSDAATMAADAEAIALAETLGLKGQQALTNTETLTRFPYPRLSRSQDVVFSALFPVKQEVSEYRDGIIPLRVLQVIAFCKDVESCKFMEIWHAGSVKEDPILVGRTSQYTSDNYLLARWGDSLPDFETLKAKALPIIKANFALTIAKARQHLDAHTATLDDIVTIYANGGSKPAWNVYD